MGPINVSKFNCEVVFITVCLLFAFSAKPALGQFQTGQRSTVPSGTGLTAPAATMLAAVNNSTGSGTSEAVPVNLWLQQSGSALVGTWTGRFSSRNFASFPVTVTISEDARGNSRGAATLSSPCLANASLVITISSSNIVLAGSDRAGDNITFKGTIDTNGTQLTLSYLLNASASGRCETDQGSGTLDKH